MQGEDTIGNWTVSQLVRFLQENQRQNPPDSAPNLTSTKLKVTSLLTIIDQIQFSMAQTTVGAAGGASALPATPSGYIPILDYSGSPFVIPYYKAS